VRKFVILPIVVICLLGCAITIVPSGPAKEFQEAAVSVKEKRYNEAVAAYKKIAADSPRSALAADALYEIALVHLFHDNPRKEYAQAIRTFEEFLKFHPDNKRAPEAQNWTYILRTIQELKKNNEQLNMRIEELKRLDVRQEKQRETR
jgi:outer membrane protein assembly factor BamD (BamD/ComL family)